MKQYEEPKENPYDDPSCDRPPNPEDLCPVCGMPDCECPPEEDVHAAAIEAMDDLEYANDHRQ